MTTMMLRCLIIIIIIIIIIVIIVIIAIAIGVPVPVTLIIIIIIMWRMTSFCAEILLLQNVLQNATAEQEQSGG